MTTSTPSGAVVTGAGRGLGKEIARLLVGRGYQLLIADLDEAAALATAEELSSGAIGVGLDVRDDEAVRTVCEDFAQRAGGIDLWVNNAGVLKTGPAWEQDAATRRLMLEVNALGTINGTVAAIDVMRRQPQGHIINIVSLAGITAVPGEAVYAASKHAAIGFSLSTVADLRLAGIDHIDISCICPDGIWTPMLFDKLDDAASALSFSGKLLDPAEVVACVEKVLDRPRLVATVPGWRGVQARVADLAPSLGLRMIPLAVAQGRRTQRHLLAKPRIGAAS